MNKIMDENNLEEETTVDADQEKNKERMSANKNKLSMAGARAAKTILSVAGIDQSISDAALQAEDFDSKPETSLLSKIHNYFSQKKENAPKYSDRASRFLEIVAEGSGIPQIKASSLVLKETAAYLTKKKRKELLSEQEKDELLNIIGLDWEELDSSAKSEFNEIKNEIKDLQGSVKLLLDMVASMNYLRGCEYIHQQFDTMSNMELVEWVNEFYLNKNHFHSCLADFKAERVKAYLSYVYQNKCSENMQPIFQAFGFLVNSRELYKLILTNYYTNITDHIFDKTPDLNPLKNVSKELEKCEKDIVEMEKVADSVVGVEGGGFIAMMNSKANLGYVPRFQDIPDDNYIGDFSQNDLVMMPMNENVKYKLCSNEGKEALQSPKPAFIKCKSTNDDYETIVAVKDGFVHRASGFRTKFKNGSECLGKVTPANVLILYIKEVSKEMEIYSNGKIRQWKKDLFWEDTKENKGFTEYFGKTPEYYVMNPKEVKFDMNIHEAAKHGKIGNVKYLLLQGVEMDEKDSEGWTPLMYAARYGHLDLGKFLINNGANVNDKDNGEETPLMNAACRGHLEVVKFLANNGARLNDKNNKGWTPLMLAADREHLEVVKFLIINGANLNEKSKKEDTPLMIAASRGYLEVVKFLITKGANINDKDNFGHTPLMIASLKGHLEIVKFLFNNGANLNEKNTTGQTALWLAEFGGQPEIAAFLRSKGCKE